MHLTAATNACDLLDADHLAVKHLLVEYARLAHSAADAGEERASIARRICDELTVHAQIEEEIFYPAVRAAAPDAQVDRAEHEHAEAEALIEQLRAMSADDERFDATVLALGKAVMQHVQEEEGELFALARASVNYSVEDAPPGTVATVRIANAEPIPANAPDFAQRLSAALTAAGYPDEAAPRWPADCTEIGRASDIHRGCPTVPLANAHAAETEARGIRNLEAFAWMPDRRERADWDLYMIDAA